MSLRPALIFDFGNVVAHFDYRKAAGRLGSSLGLSGEALLEQLRPLGFSNLLKEYEAGKITAEVFSKGIGEMIGREIAHHEFVVAWADIFTENASIAPVIAALKGQGYTLVLGSNTNDIHAQQFRRQFADTLSHFDRLVLSYQVGEIKPSAGFYLACAEAAGEAPGDCLFIDDLAENVEGAKAAGLQGLLFTTTEQLVVDLRSRGVQGV